MHIAAGYSYLATGDFRLEPQNPPLIKELLALPLYLRYRLHFNPDPQHWLNGNGYLIGQDLVYKSPVSADRILLLSRLPNLILGSVLVALIGWWAYRLWGARAAMLALALGCLEPNLVAHSSLVTTDVGATLFIFLTVYLLWEYLRLPRWWILVAAGIATGLALVSKFSTILLIPIIVLIFGASLLFDPKQRALLPTKQPQTASPSRLVEATGVILVIFVSAISIIPFAYSFQGLDPWLFGSRRFITLSREGQPAFFLGGYSYEGWWNYFPIAFLIKTPIGTLTLIFASLILWRAGNRLGRREAIFLLTPVLVVFIALTQSKVNIGLRHILPVYPFLLVLASRLATLNDRHRWPPLVFIGASVLFTAISALHIAPHHLAYFNEFVGGPDQGYRYLGDSNLDWGQDLKGVKAYMEEENLEIIYLSYFGTAPPSHYGTRYQYVPGNWPLEWPPPGDRVPDSAPRKMLAISVHNLQDVSSPHNPLFRWLWTRRPVAKLGYSIFIYDLTDDQEGLLRLEETYVKAGIAPPASCLPK